jgi:hypothetical protein
MANPWEDYAAQPAGEKPPWAEYQQSVPGGEDKGFGYWATHPSEAMEHFVKGGNAGLANVILSTAKFAGIDKDAPRLQGTPAGRLLQALDQQRQAAPDSGPSTLGKHVGEIGITAPFGMGAGTAVEQGVARALPRVLGLAREGAVARGAGAVAGGATAGATGAEMTGNDPFWGALVGGGLSAAIPAGMAGIGWLRDMARNVSAGPVGQAVGHLREMAGNNVDAFVNALRNVRPSVEGEAPMVGDAAVGRVIMTPEGHVVRTPDIPEFKVLQEGAKKVPGVGADIINQEAANARARMAVLEQGAGPVRQYPTGPGGALEPTAEQAFRTQVGGNLYRLAGPDQIPVTPELAQILGGPEVAGAARRAGLSVGQAEANMAAGGPAVPPRGTPGAPPPMRADNYMRPAENEPFMPQHPTMSIDALHRFKLQLDDEINRLGSAPGADAVRRAQLETARRLLVDQMRQGSGAYNVAGNMWGNLSEPINQASVNAALADALRVPGVSGAENLKAFNKLRTDVPQLIDTAGLTPNFQTLQQIFRNNPEGLRTINQVGQGLERQAAYEGLQAPNALVPKFLAPAEELRSDLPAFISRPVTIAKTFLKGRGLSESENVQRVIAQAVHDPQMMADLLSQVPPAQRGELFNLARQLYGENSSAVRNFAAATPLRSDNNAQGQ